MGGLLSGLLGLLALPPLQLDGMALVWLVPWLLTLSRAPRSVVPQTLPVAVLPAAYALGLTVVREPVPSLLLIGAAVLVFSLTAVVSARIPNRFARWRVGLAIGLLILGLAGARAMGIPLSLGLFAMPASWAASGVATYGIAGFDLLIGTLQGCFTLILTGVLQRGWRSLSGSAAGLLPLALLLGAVWSAASSNTSITNRASIAVIQTAIHPVTRDFRAADGVLEQIQAQHEQLREQARATGADWWVWPESAQPGYLTPNQHPLPPVETIEVRHDSVYQAPGRLESVVTLNGVVGKAVRIAKRAPLPGAEHHLSPQPKSPRVADLNGVPIGILICSDALDSRVVDQAVSEGAHALISPLNSAYIAQRRLSAIQADIAHLQAARTGLALLMVGNGGPTRLLLPDGATQPLLPPYTAGVTRVELPLGPPHGTQALGAWGPGLALVLVTAWLGRGVQSRHPPAQPVRAPGVRWIAPIGVTMAVLLPGFDPSSMPPEIPPRYDSVTPTAGPPLRGALALIAREFGHAVQWSDVPENRDSAMEWLCRTVGLRPVADAAPGTPGYGLLTHGVHHLAVRQEGPGRAIVFDPRTGHFTASHPESAGIQWLHAVQSPAACHSAPRPLSRMNGTGRE